MAPIKPRARLIIGIDEPFWCVFDGPIWSGSGRCSRTDNSLEGAYQSWLERQNELAVLAAARAEAQAADKAAHKAH